MKDEIFEILHGRIIAGQYGAGEWLRQEDISSQLGVSMTPVREALELLVSAGLAERMPYRGVRVLQPSQEEIADSYAMRLLLESTAVFAAATNISDGQLEKLSDLLEESKCLAGLKDMSRQRVLSRELHILIVDSSGNALLYKQYVTVLNTFPDWMLYEYMFRHPELIDKSMENEFKEHGEIVTALKIHNPEIAVQRTIDHILKRGRELETYLDIPKEIIRTKEAQVMPLLARFKSS
jgi:DNA-binding GntR family transcriptional regulator